MNYERKSSFSLLAVGDLKTSHKRFTQKPKIKVNNSLILKNNKPIAQEKDMIRLISCPAVVVKSKQDIYLRQKQRSSC